MEQLSFFEQTCDTFEDKLLKLFNKITDEQELPETALAIKQNISSVNSKVTSCTICIIEKAYPEAPSEPDRIVRVVNYKISKQIVLSVNRKIYNSISLPGSCSNVKMQNPKETDSAMLVYFNLDDNNIFKYLFDIISYCLANYDPVNTFGCCGKYAECSARGKCIHSNILYAKGCYYRKNLESGKIFY